MTGRQHGTPYSWRLPGEEYPHPISVIKDRFGIKKNY
jgi:hypothetical protein